MSLLINQGVHEVDEILIADNAIGQITNTKLHPSKDGFILCTIRIIQPAHFAGKTVNYDCPYTADHPVAFLYINLRKAAGVPYMEGEPQTIDIGTMLQDKAIKIKLSAREYEGSDYQDVKVMGSPNPTNPTPVPISMPGNGMAQGVPHPVYDANPYAQEAPQAPQAPQQPYVVPTPTQGYQAPQQPQYNQAPQQPQYNQAPYVAPVPQAQPQAQPQAVNSTPPTAFSDDDLPF